MKNINKEIAINLNKIKLLGSLNLIKNSQSLVIFAHGSGSSRLSPRNIYVADILNKAGISTLLFDLLTQEEDQIYENRFNIELITERLLKTTQWILKKMENKKISVGYFGASTGAAAALSAATKLSKTIKAIVSRGGRPDMALKSISNVTAPTLLIVGGRDIEVIKLNKLAYDKLTCIKKLEIIPDATHLFEETGALEQVAKTAVKWFQKYLKC